MTTAVQQRSALISNIIGLQVPTAVRARGVWIWDADGKDYLDGSSGGIASQIGYGDPDVAAAIVEQLNKVAFIYRSQFTNEAAEKLGHRLVELAPPGLTGVFLSRAARRPTKWRSSWPCSTGAKSANRNATSSCPAETATTAALWVPCRWADFPHAAPPGENQLRPWPKIAPNNCFRCPFNLRPEHCALECADDLERAVREVGPHRIAAFVVEPVVGAAGGAVVPRHGYLPRIREICDRHGILMIADEVLSGVGRTGKFLAVEHWGVVPDLVVLGKGLAAGYAPMAAVLVRDRIVDAIAAGSGLIMTGHTYSFNPLGAATALAVLDVIEKRDLLRACREQGAYLRERLEGLAQREPRIGEVRGLGLLYGLELVLDPVSKAVPAPGLRVAFSFARHAQECGLLVYASGSGNGESVMVAPPLIISRAEIDILIDRLERAFRTWQVAPLGDKS